MEKQIAQNQYLKSLLEGNKRNSKQTCDQYLNEGKIIKELYEEVIKPALYTIGELWEQNKITVAAEHLATAISEGILNSYYPEIIPENYNNKKVVLACVDKEEHQVGIKMVADVFELNKWESFFLGTGFPITELIKYVDEIKPDIIALSLSVYYNFRNLATMISALESAFPNLPIVIGGQALKHISDDKLKAWKDITYVSNLYYLEDFIKKFEN